MSHFLPPVYSSQSLRNIGSAAAALCAGDAHAHLKVAIDAVASRYPGYEVLLTDSGTSALTLALTLALTRSRRSSTAGLIVAAPAYACPDVGTAALAAGARLALYDTDPETLEPDWDDVKRVLGEGAAVLVVAHLFGRVIDLSTARELAAAFGTEVVEDAAQHAGGSVNAVRGGAQGSLSVLSFGRGKGLNAGGGGALLCRKGEHWPTTTLSTASRGFRPLLVAAASNFFAHPRLYGLPARIPTLAVGQTRYHKPSPVAGMPMALLPLLVAALQNEPVELSTRRSRETQYGNLLSEGTPPGVRLIPWGRESGALRTPILIDAVIAQDIPQLSSLGVVRSYPRSLADYPELAERLVRRATPWFGAAILAKQMHTMPTHSWVRDHDIELIASLLRQ